MYFFSKSNHIYFNTRKTIGIKFHEDKKEYEKALLEGKELTWADNVRHHGNFVCSSKTYQIDCNYKRSMFILTYQGAISC